MDSDPSGRSAIDAIKAGFALGNQVAVLTAGLSIAKNAIKSSSSKPNEPSQSSSSTPSKPAQPKPPSKISPNGVRFVADYEKFVPSPEDDGCGNLTVGYGHVVKKTETFGAITQEEALSLLATDLSYTEELCN